MYSMLYPVKSIIKDGKNKYLVRSSGKLQKLSIVDKSKSSPLRYGISARNYDRGYVAYGTGNTLWYVSKRNGKHVWRELDIDPDDAKVMMDGKRGTMRYWKHFIPRQLTTRWLQYLLDTVPFQAEQYKSYGKTGERPRLSFSYGDKDLSYSYAGITRVSNGWDNPVVLHIRQMVEAVLGIKFNYVLLNLYKTGEHYIGWHADDETDIVPRSVIASISLGAERPFKLRKIEYDADGKRKDGTILSDYPVLANGSLVTMEGTFQENFKHSVPASKTIKEPRINLTFRQLTGEPRVRKTTKKVKKAEMCPLPATKPNAKSGDLTIHIPHTKETKGMCKYAIKHIPGLYIIPEFLSKEEESVLLKKIKRNDWLDDLKRQVQHYGYKYDYKTTKVDKIKEKLPEWSLDPIIKRAIKKGLIKEMPDQLIINKYEPGEGIGAHTDSNVFGDTIISTSLQSPTTFEYVGRKDTPYLGKKYLLWLEPRSLLIMQGDARWKFTHSMPANKFDYVKDGVAVPYADRQGAKKVARGTRISMTFRNVV